MKSHRLSLLETEGVDSRNSCRLPGPGYVSWLVSSGVGLFCSGTLWDSILKHTPQNFANYSSKQNLVLTRP